MRLFRTPPVRAARLVPSSGPAGLIPHDACSLPPPPLLWPRSAEMFRLCATLEGRRMAFAGLPCHHVMLVF